jgi:Arc/MetJ family transcription regulator
MLLEGAMAVTSIDIDPELLATARALTGATSNREVVSNALDTLIAIRRQPEVVERIIARTFEDAQIESPHA